uniref:Uncharacterized protein n=1 Tax=Oryza nivara TaxID=4536 RepID=A0A0E0HCE6_ORYNI
MGRPDPVPLGQIRRPPGRMTTASCLGEVGTGCGRPATEDGARRRARDGGGGLVLRRRRGAGAPTGGCGWPLCTEAVAATSCAHRRLGSDAAGRSWCRWLAEPRQPVPWPHRPVVGAAVDGGGLVDLCISQQFNKDDITAYEISCFLHPVSDIQLFILSIFRQELSIHLSALHCQMADMGARQQVMMRTGTQAKLHEKVRITLLNYHGQPNYPPEPQNRTFFTPNFANQTNNPPGSIRGGSDPTCVPSEAAPIRADAAADVQTGCRTMLGLIVTGIAGGALTQAALAEAAKPIKLGPPPPPSGEGEVLPAAAAAGGRRRRGRRSGRERLAAHDEPRSAPGAGAKAGSGGGRGAGAGS